LSWKLIDDPAPRSGAWNMAMDEALWQDLEESAGGECVLRLYGWDPPCLSLGFHQRLEDAVDAAYCREHGIDVVRRPTGGKAVLHEHEVTYAVAGSAAEARLGSGLAKAYAAVSGALKAALESLGFSVCAESRPARLFPGEAAPCFEVPTEHELLIGGKKVVGSAQRRGRRAFLQHGSIPLTLDYERLAGASGISLSRVPSFRASFAGLRDFRADLDEAALRRALADAFRAHFPGRWTAGEPTVAQRRRAEALLSSRDGGPEAIDLRLRDVRG